MYLPPQGLMTGQRQQPQEQPQQQGARGLLGRMPAENWFALAAMLGAPQGPQRQQAQMQFAQLAQQQRMAQEERLNQRKASAREQQQADALRRALAGGGGPEGAGTPLAAALPYLGSEQLVDVATQPPSRYSVREGDEIVNYESHPITGSREIGRGGAHAPPSQTIIRNEGEDAFNQRMGEQEADLVGQYLYDDSIYNKMESARTMLGIIANAGTEDGMYMGPGGEIRTQAARLGEALGLDMSNLQNVDDATVARAISNEMAANLRSLLPGPMSDSDREFLRQMVANINNTPAANRVLMEIYMRTLEREALVTDAVRRAAAQNPDGRIAPGQINQIRLQVYQENGDIFTPQDQSRYLRAAGAEINDPRR